MARGCICRPRVTSERVLAVPCRGGRGPPRASAGAARHPGPSAQRGHRRATQRRTCPPAPTLWPAAGHQDSSASPPPDHRRRSDIQNHALLHFWEEGTGLSSQRRPSPADWVPKLACEQVRTASWRSVPPKGRPALRRLLLRNSSGPPCPASPGLCTRHWDPHARS